MTDFPAKISLQMNYFTYIKSVALEAKDSSFPSVLLDFLKVKLTLVNKYWEKFEQQHEQLFLDIVDKKRVDSLLEQDYFKNGVYDQCLQYYAEVKATLIQLIDEKDRANSFSEFQLANLSLTSQTTARSRLPEITLPQFSGDFSAWRPFHDLFSSMVGKNPDISNVEKMHYLRTSLTGEAAQLISNLPVAEDSFASAWVLLVERFENKRLLISSQVKRLFGIKPIATRSAQKLNAILNTTTEALNALQSLDAPVHHWDHLLVHLIVHRLDSHTREAWEVKLGSSTDPPSYRDLKTFLTGRARALESMEHGASASASGTKPSGCSLCAGTHYIDTFRDMTPYARRNLVIKRRLRFNRLGRHNAVACQNQKRCRDCGNKHHTIIHTDAPRHTSTPQLKPATTILATQTSAPASPDISTKTQDTSSSATE